jgi:nucleoid DNA-binding protein
MKTVNKIMLTRAIAKETFITTRIVKKVIDSFFDQIKGEYKKGNRIELREFGTFFPYIRKPRTYKTFDSKETKKMEAKQMLKFKCSKHLHL